MRVSKSLHFIRRLEYGQEVWIPFNREHISFRVEKVPEFGNKFEFHTWRFNLFLCFGYSSGTDDYQEFLLGELYSLDMLDFLEQSFISLYRVCHLVNDAVKSKSDSEVICKLLSESFNVSVSLHIYIKRDESVVFKTGVYSDNLSLSRPKDIEFNLSIPMKDLGGKIAWSNPSFAPKAV